MDIFLEAFESASGGEILLIDNQGRTDEACIGDLTVIEAMSAGVSGMAVWGLHRDTAELLELDLPVFSYGSLPAGPTRVDGAAPEALVSAQFGDQVLTREYFGLADDDGAVFVAEHDLEEVLKTAEAIRATEETQAERVRRGETLRDQLGFREYLEQRATDPTYTLRQHLRARGGAIEE